MVFSNIDLLKELYIQSKTRNCVDTCLQAKNGCIFVHWTVLIAAGNDWLVDVGGASILQDLLGGAIGEAVYQ